MQTGEQKQTLSSRPEARPGPAWCILLSDMLGEWKQPLLGEVCSQVARCGGVEVEGGAVLQRRGEEGRKETEAARRVKEGKEKERDISSQ